MDSLEALFWRSCHLPSSCRNWQKSISVLLFSFSTGLSFMSGWRSLSLIFKGRRVSFAGSGAATNPDVRAIVLSVYTMCHHTRRRISVSKTDSPSWEPSRWSPICWAILMATPLRHHSVLRSYKTRNETCHDVKLARTIKNKKSPRLNVVLDVQYIS